LYWRGSCCCCCFPMAELVYLTLFTVLSGAPNTQSACQTPKYCFLVGHVCMHTQHSAVQAHPGGVLTVKASFLLSAPPSSTQTPFPSHEKSAVLGIRTGDLSDQRVRRSNHYTIDMTHDTPQMSHEVFVSILSPCRLFHPVIDKIHICLPVPPRIIM
jgi:hypothetical protein